MIKSRLAIFASGSGSNAESIMRYFQNHATVEVGAVASNKTDAFVLVRAKKFNVPTKVFDKNQFRGSDDVLKWLEQHKITHIVLAGFLLLIPDKLIAAFPGKIINIHPSLLPKFGGKGMYGMNVHEAVAAAGEIESGLTIHLVNAHYDEGKILAQFTCPITPTDSARDIAEKVLKLEHEHYPKEIEKWASRR
ncbi:MAG TPA: phosphoribosylglycinamide formyltransferase [Cyclobacteriaceae bacterium]|jgi:phosphoribosylglycinamide formyltransferase-1|nr:phosphoribosylglycinamide formyltransferase [Cyclobacteriaceae bacterium]